MIRSLVKGIQDRGWSVDSATIDTAVIIVIHLLDRTIGIVAVKAHVVRLQIETRSGSGIKIGCKESKRRWTAADREWLRSYYAGMHLMTVGAVASGVA